MLCELSAHAPTYRRREPEISLLYRVMSGELDALRAQLGEASPYQMKRRFSDGRHVLCFTPRELVLRLGALVPPPRCHTIRCAGIFSVLRALVTTRRCSPFDLRPGLIRLPRAVAVSRSAWPSSGTEA